MSRAAGSLLARAGRQAALFDKGFAPSSLAALQQARQGMGGVPEFYGKKSAYSEGTGFLGTPPNHLDLVGKRPLAPDVFDLNGGKHYRFQPNAISSIANRVTGVVLSFGAAGLGAVSLAGCAPAAIVAVKGMPLVLYPAKAGVAFTLVYHYLGGLRHLVWDAHKVGKQSEHGDLLELSRVQASSKLLMGVSAAATLGLAAYTIA